MGDALYGFDGDVVGSVGGEISVSGGRDNGREVKRRCADDSDM